MVTLSGYVSFGRGWLATCTSPGPLYFLLGCPHDNRYLAYLESSDADTLRRGSHGPFTLHFPHDAPPLPGPIVISGNHVIGHVWGLRAQLSRQ